MTFLTVQSRVQEKTAEWDNDIFIIYDCDDIIPVSYTHLDVYKRQPVGFNYHRVCRLATSQVKSIYLRVHNVSLILFVVLYNEEGTHFAVNYIIRYVRNLIYCRPR